MIDEEMRELIAEVIKAAVGQAGLTTVGDQDMIHTLHEEMWATMNNIADSLPNTAGMDATQEAGTANQQPFDIESTNDTAITLKECIYQIGGVTYDGGTQTVAAGSGYIALKVTATGGAPAAEVAYYATLEELQTAQADKDNYIRPLYRMAAETSSSGKVTLSVELDMRSMPDVQMYEF